MPEGPEIRRAADRIAAVLENRVVEEISFGLPGLQPREEELRGQRVTALETRGKALLTHFDNGLAIYSHNQLYGRWWVVRRDRYPATGRSLRLALHTRNHSALLYSASDIAVLDRDELGQHPFLCRVGPDILDRTLHWRDVAGRLVAPRFCGRSVAALYLDQSFLAGVGNYLRSEILHDAGICPRSRPRELTVKRRNSLARSTLVVSERAYRTGGITNPPHRVDALQRAGLPRSKYRHAVFGRGGNPCYRCRQPVVKEIISARRLYWCPQCQSRD